MRHCMVVVVLLLLCAATSESVGSGRPSQSTGAGAAGPQGGPTGADGGVFGWPASPGLSAAAEQYGPTLWRAFVAVAAALMWA
jgi:hypothetical protein